jgi:hypothetical protein
MSDTFTFGSKLKKWVLGLAVVGLVLGVVLGWFMDDTSHHSRLWANLLLNTYYFAGIAVTSVFFITAHQLGYGGWHTVFKKIPIAMSRFLYIAFGLMVVIVLGMWFFPDGLYSHWANPHYSDPLHSSYDSIVADKAPFLTRIAYSGGVLLFFGLWALFAWILSKKFVVIRNWKEYSSAKKISAAFLLVFGVSSSVLSWWVIMSLDPHWYSTLFGWYNLASYFCAGFAMMILIIIGLKRVGHLPNVTEDHIHDIAKLMFGFSIFWTYLMFSQFMLIWYANIPEATIWFNKRFDIPFFKAIFFLALAINFFLPVLAILKRDAKRNYWTVGFVSVMLIFGHYLDFYHMVMLEPMAVGGHGEDHGDAHAEEHATANTETVLYADNHDEASHETMVIEEQAVSVETVVEHVVTGEHAEDHSEEHAVDAHAEDAHAGDAHAEDAHAGDAHAEDAHAVDAHAEDAHAAAPLTHAKLGLVELLFFVGFLGLFLFMTFTGLDGEDLETKEDPFLEESLHHHIKFS